MDKPAKVLVTRLVALTATAIVATVFLSRFPIPLIIAKRHLPALGGVIAVLLAAWFVGQTSIRVCSRFFAGTSSPQCSLTDSILVGIPIYGTLIAAISWTGISIRTIIPVATLVLAAPAIVPVAKRLKPALAGTVRIPAILLPPAAVAAFSALLPVNSPDELIYKLSVPKAWLEWGKMIELPLNSHAYFPASIYSADLGAITIGGGGAARALHLALFILALRVIWRLGNDIRPDSGLWAAAIFAWTPALLIIAGWAWDDWGLLGLLLLSWHRFIQFVEENDDVSGATAALALAGAISAKYTAGPWIAVFLPIAAILLYRARRHNAWRILLRFAVIIALFGGFFYLRNFVWSGSPLAPFGLPDSPAVGGFRSDHGGWWELLHGYNILYLEIIDDALGMLLPISVVLSPLALAFAGRRQLPFFLMGALQSIWLISFAPMSRLMLLGLGPLVLLGAAAGHAAIQRSKHLTRVITGALVGVMLIAQLILVMFTVATSHEPFNYLVGAENDEQYLARMRPFARPYAWIEQETPPSSVILMLGQTHAWHLNRRAHWAGNLDGPRVAAWLGQAGSTQKLRQQLEGLGITHVLIHKKWYQVHQPQDEKPAILDEEFALRVTKETDKLLQDLLREHSTQRYEDNLHLIFELKHPFRDTQDFSPQ